MDTLDSPTSNITVPPVQLLVTQEELEFLQQATQYYQNRPDVQVLKPNRVPSCLLTKLEQACSAASLGSLSHLSSSNSTGSNKDLQEGQEHESNCSSPNPLLLSKDTPSECSNASDSGTDTSGSGGSFVTSPPTIAPTKSMKICIPSLKRKRSPEQQVYLESGFSSSSESLSSSASTASESETASSDSDYVIPDTPAPASTSLTIRLPPLKSKEPSEQRGGCVLKNSNKTWVKGQSTSSGEGISQGIRNNFVSIICAANVDKIVDGSLVPIFDAFFRGNSWAAQAATFHNDSLAALAQRCHRSENLGIGISFISMINFIQFEAKFKNVLTMNPSFASKDVVAKYLDLNNSNHYRNWRRGGTTFAKLAEAGSIYFLLLVAIASEKTALFRASETEIDSICGILLDPSPQHPLGKLVIQNVIPGVNVLRNRWPLSSASLFSPSLILDYKLPPRIFFSDIEASTLFLRTLRKLSISSERNSTTWAACLEPVNGLEESLPIYILNRTLLSGPSGFSSEASPGHSRPPSPCTDFYDSDSSIEIPLKLKSQYWEKINAGPPLPLPELHIIKTNFDPQLKENMKFIGPKGDRQAIVEFTDKERRKVKNAPRAQSLEEFEALVKNLLKTGKRESPDAFVRINPSILGNKVLRIDDKNGNLLLLLIPTMPENLREFLVSNLEVLWPDHFKVMDTSEEGLLHLFDCLHFTFYNCFSTQGEKAPSDIEPSQLQRMGARRLPNPRSYIPRASKELTDNLESYNALRHLFGKVFDWQKRVVERYLPEKAAKLQEYVDQLPDNEISPMAPFGSLVVNLNVATTIHRDWNDWDICGVLVASDCEGGDTVYHELGVAVEGRNGDFTLFPSVKISHYNLHYKGKRASLVFHTDRSLTSQATQSVSKEKEAKTKDKTKNKSATSTRRAPTSATHSEKPLSPAEAQLLQELVERSKQSEKTAREEAIAQIRKRNADELDQDTSDSDSDTDGKSQALKLKSSSRKRSRLVTDPKLDKDELDLANSLGPAIGSRSDTRGPSHGNDAQAEDDADELGPDIEEEDGLQRNSEEEEEDNSQDIDEGEEDGSGADVEGNDVFTNGIITRAVTPSQKRSKRQKGSSSKSGSERSSSKVCQTDFTPRTKELALRSKNFFRERAAFGDAFLPKGPEERATFHLNLIKQAAATDPTGKLTKALRRATKPDNAKVLEDLVTFGGYGRGGLTNTLASKTFALIGGHYQIPGSYDKTEIDSKVKWLLANGRFKFGGIDMDGQTFDPRLPFGNAIFADVIRSTWFSRGKLDQAAMRVMVQEKRIKGKTISLVAASVENSLKRWSSGTAIAINFSDDNCSAR
ncbi:hypothetical protein GALMADRAFT_144489 [Galerina marginata CBS 339.88]|uniref:DUF6532 domain-containing protein n=1 Tax=Galerina marginata (strain CBS 339.88) TaxID=685588 RepID=A0A067SI17_GALM3|nr:hypothetical protein GALMADRAFT_144489 [Galerina marginata CBS 339.88]